MDPVDDRPATAVRASGLPVVEVLPSLANALAEKGAAVLVAPPGAGKTTLVPLALLGAGWLKGRRLLILEPRRLAARAAAERMASVLGEELGGTIGLRARLDTVVGPSTRIEVLTEGVFARMILDDPELTGVGAVLFDEVHERSLDADLGLALALDAKSALRPDLRLLAMSATLDATRVAAALGNAPVIVSEGRAFPVTTRYIPRRSDQSIERQVADAVMTALAREHGSLLVFLPGQGEIRRTAELLETASLPVDVDVLPLHGGLDRRQQAAAIAPAAPGRRKVVLATSIAETSLTIDGVRVVIDCGLERVPRHEPDVGITRLVTERVSRASADQRRGRAGRTGPGVCYRLWSEPETQGLRAFREPEIRVADLAPLVLDCAAWGVNDAATLTWLDPPPPGAIAAARAELQLLGALDRDGRLTARGRALRRLPLPPRLANMVVQAAARGAANEAAQIAALLVERGLGGSETDLEHRLAAFRRDRSRRATDMRRLAAGWAREAAVIAGSAGDERAGARSREAPTAASLLALAYPDRIAMARGGPGQFLLASGRAASLEAADPLARSAFLVVADLAGTAQRARILLAAATSEAEIRAEAADRLIVDEETTFDEASGTLRARRVERLGALVLRSEPRPLTAGPATARALAEAAAARGIDRLPWSKAQLQLRARIGFLARLEANSSAWPDLSDAALAASVKDWLAPYLERSTALADIDAALLGEALEALIPWALRPQLDDKAPSHFLAPTGQRHPIDYAGEGAPILAIRVQELFGLNVHPSIAGGRIPLTLHLLSPAGRPLQITRDLPGFWAGSWRDVRVEMRGRYPKHFWPEDPQSAAPTARAKPRGV